jgi:hypothetical protein
MPAGPVAARWGIVHRTDAFETKRGRKAKKEKQFEESDLFEQVGRLQVENEFLKKKYR